LFTAAGSEPGLEDRIAAGLPASYQARSAHSPSGAIHTLTADAGDYVQVTGGFDRAGLLKIIVGTGCRTLGHQPAGDPSPGDADRAALQPTVAALGMTGTAWSVHELPCGARTVEVSGRVTKPLSALHQAAATGAKVVVDRSDVYADQSGLAVRGDDNTATVTMFEMSC
jgi:hypothetical protein